jgi:adsorption protein B
MGIVLQGTERFGWRGKPGEVYWLWRDRKGLLGNLLSLLANAVFAYGVAASLWLRVTGVTADLAAVTFALQCMRTGIRMGCSARIYGWPFAALVPLRTVYGNFLNSSAAVAAVARYAWAKLHRRPLSWLKTAHAYPARTVLVDRRRRIGEILVGAGYLTAPVLEDALASCPEGVRIGEHLVRMGRVAEESLYDALSLQQGLPLVQIDPETVPPGRAHALPAHVVRTWRVLPFRVEEGSLHLAGPEAPSPAMTAALGSFTSLEMRFHLMTPSAFEELVRALL